MSGSPFVEPMPLVRTSDDFYVIIKNNRFMSIAECKQLVIDHMSRAGSILFNDDWKQVNDSYDAVVGSFCVAGTETHTLLTLLMNEWFTEAPHLPPFPLGTLLYWRSRPATEEEEQVALPASTTWVGMTGAEIIKHEFGEHTCPNCGHHFD